VATACAGDAEVSVAAFSLARDRILGSEPLADAPERWLLSEGNGGGFASSYAIAPSVIGTAGASFDLPGQASRCLTRLMGALASRGRAR
jgi:hypothetical protein